MPILGVVSGVTYLSVATDAQPMASIGGCPSTAFPLPAGSTVDEQAGLVSDWPPHTLGCWTANSEIGTEAAAFAFYMEPSNTPGWTGSANLCNDLLPFLRQPQPAAPKKELLVAQHLGHFVGPDTDRARFSSGTNGVHSSVPKHTSGRLR